MVRGAAIPIPGSTLQVGLGGGGSFSTQLGIQYVDATPGFQLMDQFGGLDCRVVDLSRCSPTGGNNKQG